LASLDLQTSTDFPAFCTGSAGLSSWPDRQKSPGSNGASQGADLTICKPTRSEMVNTRHRPDGLDAILNWLGRQKRDPSWGAWGLELRLSSASPPAVRLRPPILSRWGSSSWRLRWHPPAKPCDGKVGADLPTPLREVGVIFMPVPMAPPAKPMTPVWSS
jgi:hypothetical protein